MVFNILSHYLTQNRTVGEELGRGQSEHGIFGISLKDVELNSVV